HEYRPHAGRGRQAVRCDARAHPPDRGQGAAQAAAPEPLGAAAELPRHRVSHRTRSHCKGALRCAFAFWAGIERPPANGFLNGSIGPRSPSRRAHIRACIVRSTAQHGACPGDSMNSTAKTLLALGFATALAACSNPDQAANSAQEAAESASEAHQAAQNASATGDMAATTSAQAAAEAADAAADAAAQIAGQVGTGDELTRRDDLADSAEKAADAAEQAQDAAEEANAAADGENNTD